MFYLGLTPREIEEMAFVDAQIYLMFIEKMQKEGKLSSLLDSKRR